MAYLACDKRGFEWILVDRPYRENGYWFCDNDTIELPHGSIAKLIGRELTWEDEPVELK